MEMDTEAEKVEMLRLLKLCQIHISNYVYTIKIVIDRRTSVNDPRICKEEYASYIPEPFATYLASLGHIRKPGSELNPYDCFGTEIVGPDGKPHPECDPYVFAMLSALRSMTEVHFVLFEGEFCVVWVVRIRVTSVFGEKQRISRGAYLEDSDLLGILLALFLEEIVELC